MRQRTIAALGALLIMVAGCARVDESSVYSPEDMNQLESYQLVTVIHAEEVTIDPDSPGLVGAGLGAASGGYAGSALGGESAAVALAVVGGIAGYLLEQELSDTTATRYVIDVGGARKVIVQKDTDGPLRPGETAVLIGDYRPKLVKAPQEIIDAARQNGAQSRVRVDEETGAILFDDDLGSLGSASEPAGSSQDERRGDPWVEPGTENTLPSDQQ